MEGRMAIDDRLNWQSRAAGAFQPVSNMLDNGRCEPLKAAVHGVLFATVSLCAAYNTAAWLKRRQRHLAVNAIIYISAAWWERCHIIHHLEPCHQRHEVRVETEGLPDAA
jgi:hypothetical protein